MSNLDALKDLEIFVPDTRTAVPLRRKIRDISRHWMNQVSGWRVNAIPHPEGMENLRFNRHWRIEANRLASNEIYVLADDDIVIWNTQHLANGLALMQKYPTFAILSAYPAPNVIQEWRPKEEQVKRPTITNEDVMEHYECGGFRFVRKWTMPSAAPISDGVTAYDREFCRWLRSKGYRVGYMRNVHAFHLGQHCSTLWKT